MKDFFVQYRFTNITVGGEKLYFLLPPGGEALFQFLLILGLLPI